MLCSSHLEPLRVTSLFHESSGYIRRAIESNVHSASIRPHCHYVQRLSQFDVGLLKVCQRAELLFIGQRRRPLPGKAAGHDFPVQKHRKTEIFHRKVNLACSLYK